MITKGLNPKGIYENALEASGLTRLEFAAVVYEDRNLPKEQRGSKGWRRLRSFQPWGFFASPRLAAEDRHGVWIPHPMEVRPCCQVIQPAGYKFPWTYNRHCRSVRHVAMLMNVDEKQLAQLVLKPKAQKRCANCARFCKQADYLCSRCRREIDGEYSAC